LHTVYPTFFIFTCRNCGVSSVSGSVSAGGRFSRHFCVRKVGETFAWLSSGLKSWGTRPLSLLWIRHWFATGSWGRPILAQSLHGHSKYVAFIVRELNCLMLNYRHCRCEWIFARHFSQQRLCLRRRKVRWWNTTTRLFIHRHRTSHPTGQ